MKQFMAIYLGSPAATIQMGQAQRSATAKSGKRPV